METDKAFKLLIVDDEIPAVQVIKCAVDWKAIGVTSVYAAYDLIQAQKAFKDHSIDIMLCDIEMPQGSGLELLEWVCENHPKTESIILTCHADFSYARKAIKLGCLDYLLKPVSSAELENVVVKAIKRISNEARLQEYEKKGKLWVKYQPLLIERFWVDILDQKIPAVEEEIIKAADMRNITIDMKQKVFPVLIKVRGWHEEMSPRDEKLMEFALKNSAEDLLIRKDKNGYIVEFGKGTLVCLLLMNQYENFSLDRLQKDCDEYITTCNRYFCCDLCCYIGEAVFIRGLADMVGQLNGRDRNNVSHINKVVSKLCDPNPGPIKPPDINLWQKMLEEGLAAMLLKEVEGYLRGLLESRELNENILYQFQQDFMQVIHTYLKQRGILAHQLFRDSTSTELITGAVRSVDNMIKWVRHDVEIAVSFSKKMEKSQSVIDQIKRYIHLHIGQDLTCEDISGQVHFNSDYLTRLFKKETGMTISEYIANERLNIAKKLLSRSDMPVTAVALQAGYKSLSHFSTTFKKNTGKNPVEFRQENFQNKCLTNVAKTKMISRL